jgi:hypothetical protein
VVGEPIEIAKAEAVAARLNGGPVSAGDLPDGSYYAAAGLVKDGIVNKIRSEMQERFQKEPMDLDGASVAVAYGYLQASVAFTIPYFENREALVFTDGQGREARVSSFGLRRKDESKYRELRAQPEVLYLTKDPDKSRPVEFALDLCRNSKPNQVILAQVAPKETLGATLADLEQKMAHEPPDQHFRRLDINSVLLVPNLRWSLSHHFAELEGKRLLNDGFEGINLGAAIQRIDFRLDRSGVELRSEAAKTIKDMAPDFLFDRPFLIVVKKRAAKRPFFVMWVENAELLSK